MSVEPSTTVSDYSDESLFFATDSLGEPVHFDPRIRPHLLVVGATGSGKSETLRALINAAARRQAEIHVIDTVKGGADFDFDSPRAQPLSVTAEDAAVALEAVYGKLLRRNILLVESGVRHYWELPKDVRPKRIYLIIDEFAAFLRDRSEPTPVSAKQEKILILIQAILRKARGAGVTLVFGTQEISADVIKVIGSSPGVRDLFSRVLLGNPSSAEKVAVLSSPWAADEPMSATSSVGCGLFEQYGGQARAIRVSSTGLETVADTAG